MKFLILVFFILFAGIIFYLTRICHELAEYAASKLTFEERYWLGYNLKCANIVDIIAIILGILFVCIS